MSVSSLIFDTIRLDKEREPMHHVVVYDISSNLSLDRLSSFTVLYWFNVNWKKSAIELDSFVWLRCFDATRRGGVVKQLLRVPPLCFGLLPQRC